MSRFEQIPGSADLISWFGLWPSFHDAEVLSIHLNRQGESKVVVHTWQKTDEVDGRGHFVLTKHVVVTFLLESTLSVKLEDFNHQNVISGLSLDATASGYRLILHPCFGAEGMLEAERVRIKIQPGVPAS